MTKKKDPASRRLKKQEQWIERTQRILGLPADEVRTLLATQRTLSIRINPLVEPSQQQRTSLAKLLSRATPSVWCPNGYMLDMTDDERQTADELAQSGVLYLQNAASWLPTILLDARKGQPILDICAAPGGKTSHIAAIQGSGDMITANDNSKPRLMRLQRNLQRLNATAAEYSLHDATNLHKQLPTDHFAGILLDAPCSGEGMMSITQPKDMDSWSPSHIKRLSKLQKQAILSAWKLLQPGGRLVYSTCTMAPEENEVVVDYLLKKVTGATVLPIDIALANRTPSLLQWNDKTLHPDVQRTMRLTPSHALHAFYVAVLEKTASDVHTG